VRTVAGTAWDCCWTPSLADGQLTVQGPFLDKATECDFVYEIGKACGRGLPADIECGILACGPAGTYCARCGHDLAIALSCLGRGLCPSCATRHMAETADRLVEHLFPQVPVRQWGMRFHKRLRLLLQRDPVAVARW